MAGCSPHPLLDRRLPHPPETRPCLSPFRLIGNRRPLSPPQASSLGGFGRLVASSVPASPVWVHGIMQSYLHDFMSSSHHGSMAKRVRCHLNLGVPLRCAPGRAATGFAIAPVLPGIPARLPLRIPNAGACMKSRGSLRPPEYRPASLCRRRGF
jgi:hypothetical protein